MLRLAMRIADVDESTSRSYAEKAAPLAISSLDQNALFTFSDQPAVSNPMWVDVNVNNRDDFCVSELLVQTLTDMGDPRLDVYSKPNNSGDIVGMPYGLEDGAAFALKDISSRPSDAVRTMTAPHLTMDLAQTSFFLSEAAARGYSVTGSAEEHYANAVRASMNMWGISDDAAIDAYIAANPYDGSNYKASIGMQKWIHLYTHGLEAWTEWRRLDYPELQPSEFAVGISVIPVSLTNKVWWDVN